MTIDALEPFRVALMDRPAGDPAPLEYLQDMEDRASGAFDVTLDVWLATNLYWTFAQMLSHHTSNGCNLRPGDLLASGTISGPTRDALGCLLELTRRGSEPIKLPGGETRAFLQDGDEIVFTAHCDRESAARIGFGECRGLIVGSGPV